MEMNAKQTIIINKYSKSEDCNKLLILCTNTPGLGIYSKDYYIH